MKIYLKERDTGEIFDKGQGIKLLVDHMHCDLKSGTILVCGDSETDLPMLKFCLERNPVGLFTVWVTRNEELRETVSFSDKRMEIILIEFQVKKLCEEKNNRNYVFVSCPEVLLGGMAQATIRETSISRPRVALESQ